MKLKLDSRQLFSFLNWIVILNVFFLAGTFIFHSYLYKVLDGNWEAGSSIKVFLVEFSLANENVLATWYSSMLFLIVGVFCFLCYLIQKKTPHRKQEKNLSYGWLTFSGIFVLLSLDEIASLHERLGSVNALNPFGDYPLGWISLLALPVVLVSIFMLWFCLLQIKRAPRAAFCAIAGILLFATIPIQERFEVQAWQAADDMATWQRPVLFLIIEEGSELFGATLMVMATILFARYKSNPGKPLDRHSGIRMDLPLNKRNTVIQTAAGTIILALLMFVIVNNKLLILEGDHGRRENWFPAATAFLSFLLCLYLYKNPKSNNATPGNVLLYLGVFCLLVSAYYGGNIYAYMNNPRGSIFKIAVVAFFACSTLVLAIKLFTSVKDIYTRGAILLWALLLIPASLIFTWYTAALIFIGFSVLSVALLYNITSEGIATSTKPHPIKVPPGV